MKFRLIPTIILGAGLVACAQVSEEKFPLIGELGHKTIREYKNDLTIGCETLDRDYADYDEYKDYLTRLGMKKIRLQAGWAKTEKVKGVYDFAWLDHIIDDAHSRGMTILLETSYGNPIYKGGGTPYLKGGWPSTPEALNAWDNWVRAMAERYKDKVSEWEMWNEPDINYEQIKDYKSIVDLNIRTAEIIKSVNPDAKIAALALALIDNTELIENCLKEFQDRGKLDLFTWITYHQYVYRPEEMYPMVDTFKTILKKYSDKIILRQGETGCPSTNGLAGALSDHEWNERSQAKWDLRRIFSDKGRDIPSCIFTLSEFIYAKGDAFSSKNAKGLLEINDNYEVVRPKLAYEAMCNLTSVFDLLDNRIPSDGVQLMTDIPYSLFYYEDVKSMTGLNSMVFWHDSEIPANTDTPVPTDIVVRNGKFKDPVMVDLISGEVRRITKESIEVHGEETTFKDIPVYDSPLLITDLGLLNIAQPRDEVLSQLQRANAYFVKKYPDPTEKTFVAWWRPSNIWTRAVYFEGLMALYSIDARQEYYDYAFKWAEFHNWGMDKGTATRHADDQCCGQTYIDLYNICPDDPKKIRDIKACIDMVVNTPQNNDWYWIDAIQMAMPVFAKLAVLTGDRAYSEKMWEMYKCTRDTLGDNGLFNRKDGFWWRDKDFDYPYLTRNGKPCYWSRGNGWVFAALARVMDIIPKSDPHYKEYLHDFKTMARAIKGVQREDGFWNPNLCDPEDCGGREGTGTALFVYGLAWGLRQGVLPEKEYLPVAMNGWNALAGMSLHPNGALGYMQGRAKGPKDGLPLEYDVIHEPEDFAVGCFLLAGSEIYKIID